MIENYLDSCRKQFSYYKMLADKSIEQLDEQDLFYQFSTESNSIAIIINHLTGNILSRWTDFLTTDGEKTWREREQEFEPVIETKEALLANWEAAWQCLFENFDRINEDNFDTIIYIRNQGHTISEALNRQITHCAYHVGQIVFIGKMIKNTEWQYLSIPKGKSDTFNKTKFEQPKRREHFTKEFLEN